jgi:hypothetical protein
MVLFHDLSDSSGELNEALSEFQVRVEVQLPLGVNFGTIETFPAPGVGFKFHLDTPIIEGSTIGMGVGIMRTVMEEGHVLIQHQLEEVWHRRDRRVGVVNVQIPQIDHHQRVHRFGF